MASGACWEYQDVYFHVKAVPLPFKNFKGAQEIETLLCWVKYLAGVSKINIYFYHAVKAGSVYIIFQVCKEITVNKGP